MPTVAFFLETLSIAKVFTFEATPKFWGMEDWRKWCKERTLWMRSKSLPGSFDVMARCYFSINICASSSSCCCIIIICSFFSRFCTLSYSCHCSAKLVWAYMGIAALSSIGIDMEISAYHSWRDLIYHLFGTDFMQYILDLFSSVSFEKLSSLCCNNAEMIPSLSVSCQHLLRYMAVPLTS